LKYRYLVAHFYIVTHNLAKEKRSLTVYGRPTAGTLLYSWSASHNLQLFFTFTVPCIIMTDL
jgi:hypothetical protein